MTPLENLHYKEMLNDNQAMEKRIDSISNSLACKIIDESIIKSHKPLRNKIMKKVNEKYEV